MVLKPSLINICALYCVLTINLLRLQADKLNYKVCTWSNPLYESAVIRDKVNQAKCISTAEEPLGEKMMTSLALVPYDEAKILPHEKTSRKFYLANEEFTIEQNWQGVGVAAVVWDSAVVLGEYLHKNPHLIKGKKVLELGAGTGLAGMVAAALGAEVLLTERESAMAHLTRTLTNNSLDKNWKISTKILDWTHPLEQQSLGDVDLVLGADIIYIEETFQDLLKTLKSLAHDSRIQVLLSCRIRYERDLKFLKMLEEFFLVSEIFEDQARHIQIFSLVRTK